MAQEFDVTLIISRVQLTDDYRVAPSSAASLNVTEDVKALPLSDIPKQSPGNLKDDAAPTQEKEQEEETGSHTALQVNGQPSTDSKPSDSLNVRVEGKKESEGADETAKRDESRADSVNRNEKGVPSHSPKSKPPTVCVWKHSSCHGTVKLDSRQNHGPDLPHGDCGDGIVNPHPSSEVPDKYWAQRRRFFSLFDNGIQLDREGWYSVTPEAIANHIAQRLIPDSSATTRTDDNGKAARPVVVLDAFVGMGANAIAFARRPEVSLVVCVDTDRSRLDMAASNCRVYKIPLEKVVFVHGNACSVLKKYKNGSLVQEPLVDAKPESGHNESKMNSLSTYRMGGMDLLPPTVDVIFLSPPWGGVDYELAGEFHLQSIRLCSQGEEEGKNDASDAKALVNGQDLLELAQKALPIASEQCQGKLAMFLPRNTNGMTLAQSAWTAGFEEIELEQNYLCGKLKTLTMYYGQDVVQKDEE